MAIGKNLDDELLSGILEGGTTCKMHQVHGDRETYIMRAQNIPILEYRYDARSPTVQRWTSCTTMTCMKVVKHITGHGQIRFLTTYSPRNIHKVMKETDRHKLNNDEYKEKKKTKTRTTLMMETKDDDEDA
eukprot:1299941-Amphidinium_carterae.1